MKELIRQKAFLEDSYVVRQKLAREMLLHQPILTALNDHVRVSTMTRSEIVENHLPDLAALHSCIGDSLSRSDYQGLWEQHRSFHNLELSFYLAILAVESMHNSESWKYWSGHPRQYSQQSAVPLDEKTLAIRDDVWRDQWLRVMFRVALFIPIGYLVSHSVIVASSRSPDSGYPTPPPWSPVSEDLDQYQERWGKAFVHPTRYRIAPRLISYATYLRYFGSTSSEVPRLAQAEADFFADQPHPDNPLRQEWFKVLRTFLKTQFSADITNDNAFPYWWVNTINHTFAGSSDFDPIRCVMTAESCSRWRQLQSDASAPPSENDILLETEAVKSSDEDVPSDSDDVLLSGLPSAVAASIRLLRELYAAGELTANQGGAVFQCYMDRVHIVVPWFWQQLVNRIPNSISEDEFRAAYFSAGLLGIDTLDEGDTVLEIFPQDALKRLGKCKLTPLSELGEQLLFPGGVPFSSNPDLRVWQSRARPSDLTSASQHSSV